MLHGAAQDSGTRPHRGFLPFTKPMGRRVNPDEETTDWRAVCGRTACTVRRAGRARALSDPYASASNQVRIQHLPGWLSVHHKHAFPRGGAIKGAKSLHRLVESVAMRDHMVHRHL